METDRLLDGVYQVALIATLWSTGLALGASITMRDIGSALRRTSLLARISVLDVVLIPALAWLVLRVVDLNDDLAVGVLLVAIASAGPVGMKFSQMARGDLSLAIALVVLLEAANAFAIPIWVALVMPAGAKVPLGPVVTILVTLVLLPLSIGGVAKTTAPRIVSRWVPPLTRFSTVGIVLVVAILLARNLERLLEAFGSGVALVALALAVASAALGWALGGTGHASRRTAALVTTVRAGGPALAIASEAFAGRPGVAVAIVVYGVIALVVALTLAVLWGRRGQLDLRSAVETREGDRDR
jgi:bile acid:Na+ symporter, BASS family